jgi:hypothetical protein
MYGIIIVESKRIKNRTSQLISEGFVCRFVGDTSSSRASILAQHGQCAY